MTVDEAIEQFLIEHLLGEKGREPRTVDDYRRLHLKWFATEIGRRRVRDVDEAAIDRIFGRMRRAGLSRSRMNHARSLYAPFFRWAKRRRLIARSPMADFELPTSTHVSREHTPPEVEQLCLLLETAVEVVPDVAPLLTLGAVTGMRRGELVTVRRSRLHADEGQLTVDAATDGKRVKPTKTRKERKFAVDPETMDMLLRHCAQMDERAELCGLKVAPDAFVFSLALDCSAPMPPDYVTKRVALLKEHLGIAEQTGRDDRPRGRSAPHVSAATQAAAPLARLVARPSAGCPTKRSADSSGAANVGPPSQSRPPITLCLDGFAALGRRGRVGRGGGRSVDPGLVAELGSIEDPQPGPIRLTARNLGPGDGVIARTGRGEGQVARPHGGQGFLLLEVGRARKEPLVHGADRLASDGHVPRRIGEHGVGFIERGETHRVAGVRPLDEEPRQVLGLRRPFTSSGHVILSC